MSTISASTTSTTAYKVTADTTGILVLQTGSTPTTAVTIGTDQSVTFAGSTSVQGLTVGRGAGSVSTNTAVGASALASNSSGAWSTAFGYQASSTQTTANQTAAFGTYSLKVNTGSDNTGCGYATLSNSTTGVSLTAVGSQALANNTTGSYNTGIGKDALVNNTTANYNTAVGYQALFTNSTGANNAAAGTQAGYATTTGTKNAFFGTYAGYGNTTGSSNTFVGAQGAGGYGCGELMTTGSKNTILGSYSGNQGGLDIRTSSNYIVLSDGDGNPRGFFDNGGNFLINTASTLYNSERVSIYQSTNDTTVPCLVAKHISASGATNAIGVLFKSGAGASVGTIQWNGSATAYNTSSDYRLKENIAPMAGALAKVSALKPVTYTWKETGVESQGFIAHELQEIVPECVSGAKDAVNANGEPEYQGIDTSFLVATLTAAIQELKAEFDAYKEAHP